MAIANLNNAPSPRDITNKLKEIINQVNKNSTDIVSIGGATEDGEEIKSFDIPIIRY